MKYLFKHSKYPNWQTIVIIRIQNERAPPIRCEVNGKKNIRLQCHNLQNANWEISTSSIRKPNIFGIQCSQYTCSTADICEIEFSFIFRIFADLLLIFFVCSALFFRPHSQYQNFIFFVSTISFCWQNIPFTQLNECDEPIWFMTTVPCTKFEMRMWMRMRIQTDTRFRWEEKMNWRKNRISFSQTHSIPRKIFRKPYGRNSKHWELSNEQWECQQKKRIRLIVIVRYVTCLFGSSFILSQSLFVSSSFYFYFCRLP